MRRDARNEQLVADPVNQIDGDDLKAVVGSPQMLARDEPAVAAMHFDPVAFIPARTAAIVRRAVFTLGALPLDNAQDAERAVVEAYVER